MRYTQADLKLLEQLATFKYLTVSQMINLGIAKYKPSIQRILKRVQEGKKPLIHKLVFVGEPRKGRLENVYYLSKYGVLLVSEYLDIEESEIDYPKVANSYFQDYHHRLATIDYHIKIFKYAKEHNLEVAFFDRYFDKVGGNRGDKNSKLQAKTRVELSEGDYIIPDINYMLIDEEGKQQLFTVEIHRGRDIKRALDQIITHCEALDERAVSKKYDLKIEYNIIFLFEFEEIKERVKNRFYNSKDMEKFREYFEFKI